MSSMGRRIVRLVVSFYTPLRLRSRGGGWCDQCAATGRRAAIERRKTQRAGARLLLPCNRGNRQLRSTEGLRMVRVLFLAPAAAGPAGGPSPGSAEQAKVRGDDGKCKSYGAEHGTDDYVQCRLAIDMQKANAERAAASLPGGR